MSADQRELGEEFLHPENGRPVRVVRIVDSTPLTPCKRCVTFRSCKDDATGRSLCGMEPDDFVAYVDDIPALFMKGVLL